MLKFSHLYSGKPLGFSSVFTAFGVLFCGIGIALILFSLEKLSKRLGLECLSFNNYGVKEEPNESFGQNLMKLPMDKDKEISVLIAQVSRLRNKLSFLKSHRKFAEST